MENNNISNSNNLDNSAALFDLIQNIQSKLNTEQTKESNTSENITENIDTNTSNNNFDISSIISMLSNNSNNSNNTNNTNTENNFGNIDINTILRLQNIFSSMNKNDPKKNLLLSLKPFLRKSRQDKINEYITMLSIGDALGIFNSRGGKENE